MTRTTPRTCLVPKRCECGVRIARGERYIEHVISPGHEDIGNTTWWRAYECRDCAGRYGRSHLLEQTTGAKP